MKTPSSLHRCLPGCLSPITYMFGCVPTHLHNQTRAHCTAFLTEPTMQRTALHRTQDVLRCAHPGCPATRLVYRPGPALHLPRGLSAADLAAAGLRLWVVTPAGRRGEHCHPPMQPPPRQQDASVRDAASAAAAATTVDAGATAATATAPAVLLSPLHALVPPDLDGERGGGRPVCVVCLAVACREHQVFNGLSAPPSRHIPRPRQPPLPRFFACTPPYRAVSLADARQNVTLTPRLTFPFHSSHSSVAFTPAAAVPGRTWRP